MRLRPDRGGRARRRGGGRARRRPGDLHAHRDRTRVRRARTGLGASWAERWPTWRPRTSRWRPAAGSSRPTWPGTRTRRAWRPRQHESPRSKRPRASRDRRTADPKTRSPRPAWRRTRSSRCREDRPVTISLPVRMDVRGAVRRPLRVAPSTLSTVLRSAQQLRPLPVQVTPSRLAAALPMETVETRSRTGRKGLGTRVVAPPGSTGSSTDPAAPARLRAQACGRKLWTKHAHGRLRDRPGAERRAPAIACNGFRHGPRRPV